MPETLGQVEVGDADHQLYSQITFRFYDIWLGMVVRWRRFFSICVRRVP